MSSAAVDPWADNFFLGGSQPRGSRAGSAGATRRNKPGSSPVTSPTAGPHTTARRTAPILVGNVTLGGVLPATSGADLGATARTYGSSSRPCSAPTGPRDFARLNKAALSQGLVTAKEQRAFREVHGRDFEQRSRPTSAASTGRRSREMPLPVGPDHVFGVKTQRSDDISAVMSYQPGREWYRTRHNELVGERQRRHSMGAQASTLSAPVTTRTVALRRKDPPRTQVEMPAWQLSKYSVASPAVSTFRSDDDRVRALRKHERESVLKEGANFGMGIDRNPAGTSRNL